MGHTRLGSIPKRNAAGIHRALSTNSNTVFDPNIIFMSDGSKYGTKGLKG
jgi:hypothetical protein